MFVAGKEARLPFGVADQDGLLATEATPERLSVQVVGPDGSMVGDPIEVDRYADGLPRAYFPLRVTIDEPGIYTARTEIDGAATEMSFQIDGADDVKVIQPGAPMPAWRRRPRPTSAACTRSARASPPARSTTRPWPRCWPRARRWRCSWRRRPSVSSPSAGRCSTSFSTSAPPTPTFGSCTPRCTPTRPRTSRRTRPSSLPLGLHFEPCLVLVGSDGLVVDRVDTIYDRVELQSRLDLL